MSWAWSNPTKSTFKSLNDAACRLKPQNAAPVMKVRRVAIVGAASTGKTWLKDALKSVLTLRGNTVSDISHRGPSQITNAVQVWTISDNTALMTAVEKHLRFENEPLAAVAQAHHDLYDITLVMGLDWPQSSTALQSDGHIMRSTVDSVLRQTLSQSGLAYKVIYGQGHQRLNHALLALGLAGEDDLARQIREQGQFAINQGRTQWQCNECSDPECEHKLFTSLLGDRPN